MAGRKYSLEKMESKKQMTCFRRLKKCCRGTYRALSSHIGLILILLGYSFAGAAIFQAIEGPHESIEKQDITELRHEIMQNVWNLTQEAETLPGNFSQFFMSELARYEEQLHTAFLHGVNSNSSKQVWDIWGSLFYCATVYTTIGYGHITPATDVGRMVTVVYALIGIPLCMVVLADLGKLFTKGIKYPWSLLRRLYYTGGCKKVRQTAPMQTISQTAEKMGVTNGTSEEEEVEEAQQYVVDDEFNLPPIIAVAIVVIYIVLGAVMYRQWEPWSYVECFYFVFVSISTIGFGDMIPEHPRRFLASFIYLLIGLSLVAMVINVIMDVVSDTIGKAKDKVIDVGKKVGINLDPDAGAVEEEEEEAEKKTD